MSGRAHRSLSLLWLAGVLLTACAPRAQPPEVIEDTRSYAVGREVAANQVRETLRSAGFAPTGPADRIQATLAYEDDRGWAWCEKPLLKEMGVNRRQPARPLDRTATVDVRVSGGQGSSQVNIGTRFEARLLNGFTNSEFDVPCRSMGTLEALVLNAIGRP